MIRTLTPAQIQLLLKHIQPYYIDGNRDHIIFYLSGMMRKAGFTQETARRFVILLCKGSGYDDEDLDKKLTTVDTSYRKPVQELNGKSGLQELIVTSFESDVHNYNSEESKKREEDFKQIFQIIYGGRGGEPENPHDPKGG